MRCLSMYQFKNGQERNEIYRDSLRPSWQDLDFSKTDRGQGLPKPKTVKTYSNGEVFDLDTDFGDIAQTTLLDVVNARRSTRKYADVPLTKKELSFLCHVTCHIDRFGPGYAIGVIPSGGATSSLETYFYLHQVSGFKQGLYHYMKDTNQLRLVRPEATPDMADKASSGQLRGAQVMVFWTATPYRTEYRYDYTAHKMIAQEAGHACQNLYLASETIDCGAVAIAAYNQELADQLIGIKDQEFVIYMAAVGKKTDE